jgi:hypothetical protein
VCVCTCLCVSVCVFVCLSVCLYSNKLIITCIVAAVDSFMHYCNTSQLTVSNSCDNFVPTPPFPRPRSLPPPASPPRHPGDSHSWRVRLLLQLRSAGGAGKGSVRFSVSGEAWGGAGGLLHEFCFRSAHVHRFCTRLANPSNATLQLCGRSLRVDAVSVVDLTDYVITKAPNPSSLLPNPPPLPSPSPPPPPQEQAKAGKAWKDDFVSRPVSTPFALKSAMVPRPPPPLALALVTLPPKPSARNVLTRTRSKQSWSRRHT